MGLQDHKILEENLTIQNLTDAPSQTVTAQQLKAKFDEFPELLRQKLNALIDDLVDVYPDEEALRLMQARLSALAGHGSALASEYQSGHVRLDGRTITLNEAGQLVVQGAEGQVASYEQALAGMDNSAVMTPLRVKQALNQSKQGLNYAISDLCAINGEFSALAWREQDGLLALASAAAADCRLYIYGCDGTALMEICSLPLPAEARTLLWNEAGDALAYIYENGEAGWALWDGERLSEGQGGPGTVVDLAWRTDGKLAAVSAEAPSTLALYVREGARLSAQRQLAAPGGEPLRALCFAPYQSTSLAAVAQGATAYRLLLLQESGAQLLAQYSLPLPAQPLQLAWQPGGQTLAVAYAAGDTALELYAAPRDSVGWRKLAALTGNGLSGLSWQGEGHYLAVSRAGTGPLYELYAFNGAELLFLGESLWQGQDNRPAFHANGRWLATLSRSALRLQAFEAELFSRLLPQSTDFTAVPDGHYLIPRAAGPLTIRCFAQPQAGQYFSFCGDFPAQVLLDGGVHTVNAGQTRGWGLYCVVFVAEGEGCWQVLLLSLAAAGAEAAQAATDGESALTPYGGGLLLAKRGRRAATVIVAAKNSLNAQAADFICSGQSDQLTLRQAMAALPANGGELALLDGTYVLDSSGVSVNGGVYRLLEIDRPGVTISGRGKSTVLKLADNVARTAGQQFYLIYGNAAGLSIRNLLCDGVKGSGNNAGKVTALALSLYAQQSEISNCVCRNCSEAGIISTALYAHIHNNWLHDNLYGLYMQGGENFLTNNDAYQNSYGLYATGSTDMVMQNRLTNNSICAVELRNCVNSQLGLNTLVGNSSGFRMYGCSFIMVKDNYVRRALGSTNYSSAEYSLWIENCTDMMVIGNWLRGKEAIDGGGCARVWASYGGTDWNPII